jgi:predicted transcriptional regulator
VTFLKKKDHEMINKIETISGKIVDNRKNSFPGEVISDFLQENRNYFPKLEEFANKVFEKVQKNNRTRYIALCDYLKSEYDIKVIDVIPEEDKPFSKIYKKNKKELLLSDYSSLETKKLHAAAQIAQEGANKEIEEYLSSFTFPSDESKKLTKVALLNYCGAAILMPYKLVSHRK